MLLEFAESGCLIFRATTPLSRGNLKSKGHGKLSIHFAADQKTIETIFRIIVSANQLSLYGAVANMCEECESLHERTEKFLWIMTSHHTRTFYCNDMKNESNCFQKKTK